MEYSIQVSKEAEKDLAIAQCYYKAKGLDSEFKEDFLEQIKYLQANPYLFQIHYRTIRKISFNTYKYAIHYTIDNDIVYIFRILNHRQEYDVSK